MRSVFDIVDTCSPIISRSMVFKLKSTDRVGNSLDSIRNRMSEVIHRIDTPLISCSWMLSILDSI